MMKCIRGVYSVDTTSSKERAYEQEFKPAQWKDDYDYGTTIVNRVSSCTFGMVLNML